MTERYVRPDGARVSIEHVTCADCGFTTGIVRVVLPDGGEVAFTGAGCGPGAPRPLRSPEVARQWADSVRRYSQAEQQEIARG